MAVKFGWFDIPIGGDPLKYKYSANQMRDIWKSLLTNGIVPEIRQSTTGVIVPTKQLGGALSANVAQGLKVTINNGLAFIDGAYFFVYTPEEIPLQAGWINDIVLRLDVTGSEIVFGIFNKQRSAGTIEAGLTRQGGVYELGLHSVNIPSGATQVTASMITDYRLNMSKGFDGLPCCGIVGSLLMPDIDAWYKSATAEQKAWFDKSQADFMTWFSTLADILDENTAGNLLNLINQNTAALASLPTKPLTMQAPITAGGAQTLTTKQVRNITISSGDPVGGVNGDMWFKYS